MIVADKAERGEIVNGDLDEITVYGRPPTLGTIQAIQASSVKDAICHVHIDDVWHLTTGGFQVRFHLAEPSEARLLKKGAKGGYTDRRDLALTDEPEAVTEEEQRRITADAHVAARHERSSRRRDQELLGMEAKIVAYQREAAHRRINIRSEVRSLNRCLHQPREAEKRLEDVRKKLDADLDRGV